MPFGLQPIHLIIVAVVALLIFGPRKLPEIGRSVGKTLTEFRKGTKEMTSSFMEEVNHPEAPVAAQAAPGGSIAQSAPLKEETQPAAEGNFCVHCGKSNPVGAVYCNSCGSKIAA